MTSLKRRFAVFSVALAAFALAGTTGLCAEDKSLIDYQKSADRTLWSFSDAAANPLFCMCRQAGADYDVWLIREPKERHELTIKIIKNGRPVYQWKGHKHSVFRIQGDRLYYAEFLYSASGGNVVAVDLNKGNELWRSPLKALGGFLHSAYRNRMTIGGGGEVVVIYGNESMGRYVEFKDTRTGKTVGHKQFPKESVKPPQPKGVKSVSLDNDAKIDLGMSKDKVIRQLKASQEGRTTKQRKLTMPSEETVRSDRWHIRYHSKNSHLLGGGSGFGFAIHFEHGVVVKITLMPWLAG